LSSYQESKAIIDLSHPIRPEMQVFQAKWHRKVEFESLGHIEDVGRRTTHIHMGTHVGTHIDAPSHFIQDGKSITDFKLDRFVGGCTFIDLSATPPNTEITVQMIEKAIGNSKIHKRLVFYFNWARFFGDPYFYSDQPFLGNEAAAWILALRPELLGYDLAMPDNPKDGQGTGCDSPMHKMFLGAGIPLLESMNIKEKLDDEFTLIALPLMLSGLDGSPVRCVAIQ
jgi:kynurenine formamidase